MIDVLVLWHAVGFAKSLQEIFERAEWEPVKLYDMPVFVGTPEDNKPLDLVPKQPEIRSLFEYLLKLKI